MTDRWILRQADEATECPSNNFVERELKKLRQTSEDRWTETQFEQM